MALAIAFVSALILIMLSSFATYKFCKVSSCHGGGRYCFEVKRELQKLDQLEQQKKRKEARLSNEKRLLIHQQRSYSAAVDTMLESLDRFQDACESAAESSLRQRVTIYRSLTITKELIVRQRLALEELVSGLNKAEHKKSDSATEEKPPGVNAAM